MVELPARSIMDDSIGTEQSYSCPACAGAARLGAERMRIATNISSRLANEPRYVESRQRDLAHRLADTMINEGFIEFDMLELPPDMSGQSFQLSGRVIVCKIEAGKRLPSLTPKAQPTAWRDLIYEDEKQNG